MFRKEVAIYYVLSFISAVVIVSEFAYADCAAPPFPTRCVNAKVTKQFKPEPHLVKRYPLAKELCKVELSSTGFRGEVYIIFRDEKPCPVKGESLLGDLGIACNDTGQDFPDTFQIKSPAACKQETAERLERQKLMEASFILVTKIEVMPRNFQKNYSAAVRNIRSARNNCVLPLMQKKQLSMKQEYSVKVKYQLTRKANESKKGTLENLTISDPSKKLPQSILECFEKEISKKRTYLENVWFDLPARLQVRATLHFGKKP